jgi:hypothetical protein
MNLVFLCRGVYHNFGGKSICSQSVHSMLFVSNCRRDASRVSRLRQIARGNRTLFTVYNPNGETHCEAMTQSLRSSERDPNCV